MPTKRGRPIGRNERGTWDSGEALLLFALTFSTISRSFSTISRSFSAISRSFSCRLIIRLENKIKLLSDHFSKQYFESIKNSQRIHCFYTIESIGAHIYIYEIYLFMIYIQRMIDNMIICCTGLRIVGAGKVKFTELLTSHLLPLNHHYLFVLSTRWQTKHPPGGNGRCSSLGTSLRRGLDLETATFTVLNQHSYLHSYSCQY